MSPVDRMDLTTTRRGFLQGVLSVSGILVFFSLVSGPAVSQERSPDVTWEVVEGGPGDDTLRDGIETSDGVFILVGERERVELDRQEMWTVGVDGGGNVLFSDPGHQGGRADESVNAIVPVGDDRVFLVGKVSPDDGIYPAASLVSIEGEGSTVWNISPTRRGEYFSALTTPNNKFVMGGTVSNADTGNQMGIITKLDGSGEKEWELTFRNEGPSQINSVVQGVNGGYVGVGIKERANGGKTGFIVKTDEEGLEVWVREFDQIEFLSIAHRFPQQGYVVVGERTNVTDSTESQVKFLDVEGNTVSDETYDEVALRSVQSYPEHEVLLLGGFIDRGGGRRGWIRGVRPSGEEIGTAVAGGERDGTFREVLLTDGGAAAMGVGSITTGEAGRQGWAVKFSDGGGDSRQTIGLSEAPESAEENPQRGFFSNDGNEPGWMSDALNLTVIGFLLSVIGIIHQMIGGR